MLALHMTLVWHGGGEEGNVLVVVSWEEKYVLLV